jgi:hypothetical protein
MVGFHKFIGTYDFLGFQSGVIEYVVLQRYDAVSMGNRTFETSGTVTRDTASWPRITESLQVCY